MNKTKIAKIISVLFHPFIIPWPAFAILIFVDGGLTRQTLIEYLISISFTGIIVPGYVIRLAVRGKVDSPDIPKREERLTPLLISTGLYIIAFALLAIINAGPLVRGLMFCYISNTLIIAIITKWWKISVHTTAISGPLGAMWFLFGTAVLPWLTLVAIVAWSRVVLKHHTVAQTIAGGFAGFVLTILQLHFLFL